MGLIPVYLIFCRVNGPFEQTVLNIHRIKIADAYLASLSDGSELSIYMKPQGINKICAGFYCRLKNTLYGLKQLMRLLEQQSSSLKPLEMCK